VLIFAEAIAGGAEVPIVRPGRPVLTTDAKDDAEDEKGEDKNDTFGDKCLLVVESLFLPVKIQASVLGRH
jgi:hypothetical protein